MKTIDHSLRSSLLLYGSQVWGQSNLKIQAAFKHYDTVPFRNLPSRIAESLLHVSIKSKTPKVQRPCHPSCLFKFSLKQNPQSCSSFKLFHCAHTCNYSTRSANRNVFDMSCTNKHFRYQSSNNNCMTGIYSKDPFLICSKLSSLLEE